VLRLWGENKRFFSKLLGARSKTYDYAHAIQWSRINAKERCNALALIIHVTLAERDPTKDQQAHISMGTPSNFRAPLDVEGRAVVLTRPPQFAREIDSRLYSRTLAGGSRHAGNSNVTTAGGRRWRWWRESVARARGKVGSGKGDWSEVASPQTSDVSLIQHHRTDQCYLVRIVSDKGSAV